MNRYNLYNKQGTSSSSETATDTTRSSWRCADLEPHDLCYIDPETARVLELVENNVDASNRKHSLMGYLNEYTCTTSGSRLLKDGILNPLCNLETLESRLNLIEFLINRVDTLSNICNHIKRFGQNVDLDNVPKIITSLLTNHGETLALGEKRLEVLTTIQGLVSQVAGIVATFEGLDQPMLSVYKTALEDPAYYEILDNIHEVIESEVRTKRNKRSKMFRIKQGVESLFDAARNTYTDAINGLEHYVQELNKDDGLNWKLNHSDMRGYFLSMAKDKLPKDIALPPKYIRVHKTYSLITCTTQEMMYSNVRAKLSYENSMKLANQILKSVLASIADNMGAIHKLVDIIAVLDLTTSFAKLVVHSGGTLVRPRYTGTETIITKGRHPILEMALQTEEKIFVPNDVFLRVASKNVMIVTGPNMGGKSILLKQVALIQIMAQLGCFVPAQSAYIKPVNRIVARSGTSDDISSTCSSFMWEMKGIATALQEDNSNSTPSALYIIDEVGRGTTIDDGASYSLTIAEELAHRINSFTIFATHFDQVFSLTALYRNVTAYHFEYEYEPSSERGEKASIKLTHNLVLGMVKRDHYGIKLAEVCGLPDEILEVAKRDLAMYNR